MQKTIKWTCPQCNNENEQEMHDDPNAHFASMICKECGYEIEGCLCEPLQEYKRVSRQYALDGAKKIKRKNKNFYKNAGKKGAKKRWNKS